MHLRRIATVGSLTAVLLAATAVPAFAVGITGSTVTLDSANNALRVTDTVCDTNQAFGNWRTIGGDTQRIQNTRGCNTTVSGGVPIGEGTTIEFRACVDKPGPDPCSGWVRQTL